MKRLASLVICTLSLLGSGCAGLRVPAPLPLPAVFSDASFALPPAAVGPEQLFVLSPAMRAYIESPEFTTVMRKLGPERGLVEALYTKGELKLEYDASVTRNAAETFDARMGNCLSLVLMTAAFAKHLGLEVQYQDVMTEEVWSRNAGLYFASTHVNLSMGKRRTAQARGVAADERMLTIDFLPPEDSARYNTHTIEERMIEAMFMNNRAAEALSEKRLDEAYWWARAAVTHLPTFATPYNTLGVIYQRHGDVALAERAFKAALTLEPESTIAMHNLVPVLSTLGKAEESKVLAARLAALEPTPPFHYFHLAMKAMQEARYGEARDLLHKEVRRAPFNHEFHFWLAIAHWRLGEGSAARDELALALDNSTTRAATERYSAKLAFLRSQIGNRQRAY
ncbi:tetratricopeptide repeat protein [Massilia pseudoviolaceinigra]|uniref:tetratricopeptide repeat protein n=1 Tax=Massilia pseudoviolaceinigra TaxID=3057165 RepID=UPI0027964A63|nr:tetratricopeptide repeat protein [Massilia sp. CCM 9206]MDQ1919724.1 tetratricopeptide repeat protein [Massilia sp. CCM 9206]